jgi:2-phospho-L-lactate guanylyltransferase (CobY/MobA/RfbA family)
MMQWTLTGLFAVSALLLVVSIVKSNRAAKAEHNQIDLVHIETMKEINALKDSLRNMELDMEVVVTESDIPFSTDEIVFKREVLDLYKRNYSIASIAEKYEVSEAEIQQMLAPYLKVKEERRKVANAN